MPEERSEALKELMRHAKRPFVSRHGQSLPGRLRRFVKKFTPKVFPTGARRPTEQEITKEIAREIAKRRFATQLPKQMAQRTVQDITRYGTFKPEMLGSYSDRGTVESVNKILGGYIKKGKTKWIYKKGHLDIQSGKIIDRDGLIKKIAKLFRRRATAPLIGREEAVHSQVLATKPGVTTGAIKKSFGKYFGLGPIATAIAMMATSPLEAEAAELPLEYYLQTGTPIPPKWRRSKTVPPITTRPLLGGM